MLGQKARCSCGTVVLLVADAHADEPELIEDIELLDNNEEELLFAQIKEADQTRSTPSRLPTTPPVGATNSSRTKKNGSPSGKPSSKVETAKQARDQESSRRRVETLDNEIPEVELKIAEGPQRANQSSRSKDEQPRRQQQPPPQQPSAPKGTSSKRRLEGQVPAPKKEKLRSPQPVSTKPLMADSFADVDDILNGGVDASPLNPRRESAPPEHSVSNASGEVRSPNAHLRPSIKSVHQDQTPSAIGQDAKSESPQFTSFLSLIGGGAGIFFSVLALATRQIPFADSPLEWLGEPMFGMYQAAYGSGAIEGIYKSLFLGLGWMLLVVAIATLITSFFLALRGMIRMVFGKGILGWSRGFSALLGVVGLFTLMAILLTQFAHHDYLQAELNRIDGGAVGLIQDLENVKLIREQYEMESQRFRFAIYFLASLPGTLFLAATINLFFDRD